jgi:hypothetical protein
MWIGFLNRGGTVEQLEAILIGSAEYFSSRGGGTVNGFLQALYGDVLRRPIDSSGSQSWGQAIANGLSRTAVAGNILASSESDQLEVQDLFRQVLRRPADTSGLSTYTTALQQGMPNELLLAVLTASDEYFARV